MTRSCADSFLINSVGVLESALLFVFFCEIVDCLRDPVVPAEVLGNGVRSSARSSSISIGYDVDIGETRMRDGGFDWLDLRLLRYCASVDVDELTDWPDLTTCLGSNFRETSEFRAVVSTGVAVDFLGESLEKRSACGWELTGTSGSGLGVCRPWITVGLPLVDCG